MDAVFGRRLFSFVDRAAYIDILIGSKCQKQPFRTVGQVSGGRLRIGARRCFFVFVQLFDQRRFSASV